MFLDPSPSLSHGFSRESETALRGGRPAVARRA